jgi:hypothetical protein
MKKELNVTHLTIPYVFSHMPTNCTITIVDIKTTEIETFRGKKNNIVKFKITNPEGGEKNNDADKIHTGYIMKGMDAKKIVVEKFCGNRDGIVMIDHTMRFYTDTDISDDHELPVDL